MRPPLTPRVSPLLTLAGSTSLPKALVFCAFGILRLLPDSLSRISYSPIFKNSTVTKLYLRGFVFLPPCPGLISQASHSNKHHLQPLSVCTFAIKRTFDFSSPCDPFTPRPSMTPDTSARSLSNLLCFCACCQNTGAGPSYCPPRPTQSLTFCLRSFSFQLDPLSFPLPVLLPRLHKNGASQIHLPHLPLLLTPALEQAPMRNFQTVSPKIKTKCKPKRKNTPSNSEVL